MVQKMMILYKILIIKFEKSFFNEVQQIRRLKMFAFFFEFIRMKFSEILSKFISKNRDYMIKDVNNQ